MKTHFALISDLIHLEDANQIGEAIDDYSSDELKRPAQSMLWIRAGECIEILQTCAGGGRDAKLPDVHTIPFTDTP